MFNEKKINDIMNRFIDCGTETGAAAVVMKNGEELYRYSCGLADAEKGRAFREVQRQRGIVADEDGSFENLIHSV